VSAALILPAAGKGLRFGGAVAKQFLDLAGTPVLARTLAAFRGHVDAAWVAVSDDGRDDAAAIVAAHPPGFPVHLIAGGATRQESVHAALRAVAPVHDVVLVHDAVRPLVPVACIDACLAALTQQPAAVVAVPCAATVKRSVDGWLVARTEPRDGLWLAQTPQGFRRELGLAAYARAAAEGWLAACSDDAQVLERCGHAVALVPGDAVNLKLTTADDLALVAAVLSAAAAPAPPRR